MRYEVDVLFSWSYARWNGVPEFQLALDLLAAREFGDHRGEIGVLRRRKAPDRDSPRPRRHGVEQAQERLRAALSLLPADQSRLGYVIDCLMEAKPEELLVIGDRLQLAVELASSRSTIAPWSNGADVRVVVTGAGDLVAYEFEDALEAIPPPAARGIAVLRPLGNGDVDRHDDQIKGPLSRS